MKGLRAPTEILVAWITERCDIVSINEADFIQQPEKHHRNLHKNNFVNLEIIRLYLRTTVIRHFPAGGGTLAYTRHPAVPTRA